MTSIGRDGSVEFCFYRREARRVTVVGDFAAWGDAPVEMKPDGDGWWRLTLRLGAGEYLFRYVADGVWYTDYASHGVKYGEQGVDSVLVVPELQGNTAGAGDLTPCEPAARAA